VWTSQPNFILVCLSELLVFVELDQASFPAWQCKVGWSLVLVSGAYYLQHHEGCLSLFVISFCVMGHGLIAT
jgi:hypothetical protein